MITDSIRGPATFPTTACCNCRRRRRRCDKSQPSCHRCSRDGEECLGYGRVLRWLDSPTAPAGINNRRFATDAATTNLATIEDAGLEEHRPNNPSRPKVDSPTTATPQLASRSTRGVPSSLSPEFLSETMLDWTGTVSTEPVIVPPTYSHIGSSYPDIWQPAQDTATYGTQPYTLPPFASPALDIGMEDNSQYYEEYSTEDQYPSDNSQEGPLFTQYWSVDSQAHLQQIGDWMKAIQEELTTGKQVEMLPVWADDDSASKSEDGPFLSGDGYQSSGNGPGAASDPLFEVYSPGVVYTDSEINNKYIYRGTEIAQGPDGGLVTTLTETRYGFDVDYAQHPLAGAGYSRQVAAHLSYVSSPTSAPLQTYPDEVTWGHPVADVPINRQRRQRRKYGEIERTFECSWNGCDKSYGGLNHLNTHITKKGHGATRKAGEFKKPQKASRQPAKASAETAADSRIATDGA